MKVLWFAGNALPAVRDELGFEDFGNRGGWVANAALALARHPDIELGVVWAAPLVPEYKAFSRDGITYFCIPMGGWMEDVSDRLRGVPPVRNAWQALTYFPRQQFRAPLRTCQAVLGEFSPELIHVHGTESFYGQLSGMTDVPVVVSLQGILRAVVEVYWGRIPWWRRPAFPRELLLHAQMKRNAAREDRILRANRLFTGRTDWDRETVAGINPGARYFSDGARLLRPEFYAAQWSLEQTQRHSIYTTITARPYKGTDTLLEALGLLRRAHPDARLRIGGHLPEHGYGGYLRDLINRLAMGDAVDLLGFVEADDIVAELTRAHAFVNASHIENSPNSVAEAQRVGTPCVASAVGGTPSMVQHDISGLLYPAGDAPALATQLERLYTDDAFATSVGAGGREAAEQRGGEAELVATLVNIYADILNGP